MCYAWPSDSTALVDCEAVVLITGCTVSSTVIMQRGVLQLSVMELSCCPVIP